jgi:hypothetical protein
MSGAPAVMTDAARQAARRSYGLMPLSHTTSV